jgi:signal peptidase II
VPAKPKLIYALGLAALALALDLGSKRLAAGSLALGEARELTGFFNLVLVMNSGAAFSLFSGEGEGQGLRMALLSLAAMVPIAFLYASAGPRERLRPAALGAVMGGALGNLHDRLRYDAVVDFLDFHWGGRHWPAFNVADVAVVVGLALYLLSLAWAPGAAPPKPPGGGGSGRGGRAGGRAK